MRRLALPALAILSGLALFASDYPVHAWWLQVVAFVPFLYGLARHCVSRGAAALGGLLLGLAYTLPFQPILQFPLYFGIGLSLVLSLLWTAAAVGIRECLREPSWAGALAAGAVVTVIEWASYALFPVWGTAQCFARVWSAAPRAIAFVSVTGMGGLVFALVATQALAVTLVVGRAGRRRGAAAALAAVVAAVTGLDALAARRPPAGTTRVAAIGFTYDALGRLDEPSYEALVAEAVGRGARLVVAPEAVFGPEALEPFFARVGALARRHGVTLVVGYWDPTDRRGPNRLAIFDPTGALAGEYAKTHLVPFFEKYRPGDGTLTFVARPGEARLGAMICHDDSFTDLARAYGRRGAQVVAVPTNDWAQVRRYHLENSRFRAIENGYGVVRATADGISTILSPRGEVLAEMDHFVRGAGVIVADLPILAGGTAYSVAGEWLPLLCLFGLAGGAALRRRRRPTPPPPGAAGPAPPRWT